MAIAHSPVTRPFEHHVLDFLAYLEFERGLSRNTLEAYRRTCSSRAYLDAAASPHRAEHATRGVPDELAAGGRPAAGRAATLQRKAACLRSFYRHLRRERSRQTRRGAARAAQEPEAAAGVSRDEVASCSRRRVAMIPRRCATGRARPLVPCGCAPANVDLTAERSTCASASLCAPGQGLQGAADPVRAPAIRQRARVPEHGPPLLGRARGAPPFVTPRGGLTGRGSQIVQATRARRPGLTYEPAHARIRSPRICSRAGAIWLIWRCLPTRTRDEQITDLSPTAQDSISRPASCGGEPAAGPDTMRRASRSDTLTALALAHTGRVATKRPPLPT